MQDDCPRWASGPDATPPAFQYLRDPYRCMDRAPVPDPADQKPVWLWSSRTQMTGQDVDLRRQVFLRHPVSLAGGTEVRPTPLPTKVGRSSRGPAQEPGDEPRRVRPSQPRHVRRPSGTGQ